MCYNDSIDSIAKPHVVTCLLREGATSLWKQRGVALERTELDKLVLLPLTAAATDQVILKAPTDAAFFLNHGSLLGRTFTWRATASIQTALVGQLIS